MGGVGLTVIIGLVSVQLALNCQLELSLAINQLVLSPKQLNTFLFVFTGEIEVDEMVEIFTLMYSIQVHTLGSAVTIHHYRQYNKHGTLGRALACLPISVS